MEAAANTMRKRLRRAELSEYLLETWGVSYTPNTLARLATQGGGPPFQKFGRFPLYPVEEADRWAAAKLGPLKTSTSS